MRSSIDLRISHCQIITIEIYFHVHVFFTQPNYFINMYFLHTSQSQKVSANSVTFRFKTSRSVISCLGHKIRDLQNSCALFYF